MKHLTIFICIFIFCSAARAQEILRVLVKDAHTGLPLADATVSAGNSAAYSDTAGIAVLKLPAGHYTLNCTFVHYKPYRQDIALPDTQLHELQLIPEDDLEEVTIVASSRNNLGIENNPLKVEVLGKEEMGEEAGIKPGNIASILGDVSGVQIQQSSAATGNSNVRIQGLDGRYTQVLRDGMPLYDGFSGGFGILTIPPLDLQQIELVKGSASTLYGGGAIGGLVNLISRKPSMKQEADVLVNYTTLGEFNVNAFASKRVKKWGYTLFAGYNNQQAKDVDGDGLSDVARSSSILVHPRLFFYPSDKTIISAGYSGTFDQRKGGDMSVLDGHTDNVHQYYDDNRSTRHTAEYFADHFFSGNTKLSLKGSVSSFDRNETTNTYSLAGRQTSYYDEASLSLSSGRNTLVTGINITGNDYRTLRPDSMPLQSFHNFTTGVFAQYSWQITDKTIAEAGIRGDVHQQYGLFVLPRAAVFHRLNDHWALRAGFGMGYKTPDPLAQQTIDYDLQSIQPVSNNVKPEISYGYNAEINYRKEWDKEHSLFVNQAFFLTDVSRPVLFTLDSATGKVSLMNADKPVVSAGFDTYVKLQLQKWELYLGYTYTDVRRTYLPGNSFMPLTPRNRFAFVVARDFEKWRIGLEGSYTGSQYRYDGSATPGYMFAAAMVQRNIGKHLIIVLNGENLLDYRMSRNEPIYTGTITNPVFKPLWAPIDGRVINLSVRWKL